MDLNDILYRDHFLIAVKKPSGLLVHPSRIDYHEKINALKLVKKLTGKTIYPLHRIDKPTSGVLLFGFDKNTAKELSIQFSEQKVEKTYLAVVRGFSNQEDEINYPLKKIDPDKSKRESTNTLLPKDATTTYKRLATYELDIPVRPHSKSRYSLICVKPKNGRHHQIRRHLKHISHPIIGDTTYGDGKHNKLFREQFNCRRLLLHARKLKFIHPVYGKEIVITAPLDDSMKQLFLEFGWLRIIQDR